MSGSDGTPDPADLDAILERLSYAPTGVDPERVLAALEAADTEERLRIAAAVDRLPPSEAGALADAAPVLIDALDADLGPRRRHVLGALATIAAAEPAAVRPAADPLVEALRAYNFWVGRAATEALGAVAVADPDVLERVGPLLEADSWWIRTRAAAVLARAAKNGRTIDRDALAACADALAGGGFVGPAAIDVLAHAGWVDPGALEPAVDRLLGVARDADSEARVAALRALTHVAAHDPAQVRDALPLFVELSTAENGDLERAAATLLVTLVLQEPSATDRVRELVDADSYFERAALVRAMAAASVGLPGRESVLVPFLEDESRFLRYEVCRRLSSADS